MTARFFRENAKGFTLLELVIVLGITGLIFGGLWGLISSGGAQLQAQTAAQQYRQVIEASRRLLAPGVAQGGFDPAAFAVNTATDLPLTVLTDTTVGLLSPNFAQLSGGSYFDAFGHEIRLKVKKLSTTDNSKWSFMVYSTAPAGVPNISDKVGAQVASLIGSEGGFVYSVDTEGCLFGTASATKSCGAFNSFAILLADMGVTPGNPGRIATLSFTSDNSLIGAPWLMRLQAPSGTNFNTMFYDLDFDTASNATLGRTPGMRMRGNTISMGSAIDSTTGGGIINVAAGRIDMLGGTLSMGANGASTAGGILNIASGKITNLGGASALVGDMTGANPVFAFNNLTLNSTTSIDIATGASTNMRTTSADPNAVTLSINGIGRADTFQAGQFIYTSDMRLKENLHPIQDALAKVLRLRGMNYQWRSNHVADVGLVAQDVEKVFPELVSSSGGIKGIDYAKMIAPLVEALRQLKEDNDALRAKLDSLETRMKESR